MRLALLVRGAVHRHEHVDAPAGQFGDGAAVLPDVLADRHADAHAVDVEHHRAFAGGEDAELVEHAVVGQEVLVVAGPHHAVVQHDHAVLRLVGGVVGADRADRDVQVAEPIGGQLGGQPVRLVPRGLAEGAAQGQILDRVAGERHLGEHHHLGAAFRGEMHVPHDLVGIGVEVADAGVDLGESETNLSHTRYPSAPGGTGGFRARSRPPRYLSDIVRAPGLSTLVGEGGRRGGAGPAPMAGAPAAPGGGRAPSDGGFCHGSEQ